MTAEIAVLNRTAVALAADSASTSLQATGLPKIFNTADKLFHLDGVSPIGIMVYGSASFMGVPWETLIKKYREVATPNPPTLAQGSENFLSFLSSAQLLSDAHLRSWLELQISELTVEAERHFRSEVERRGPPATVAQICAELAATWAAIPLLPGISEANVNTFVLQMNDVLDREIDKAFSNNPLAAAERQTLKSTVARVNLTVPREADPVVSGIAVAGLGNEELFPVLWNCRIKSVLANRMLQRTPAHYDPFFFNDTATTEIYTLSLHDALPICAAQGPGCRRDARPPAQGLLEPGSRAITPAGGGDLQAGSEQDRARGFREPGSDDGGRAGRPQARARHHRLPQDAARVRAGLPLPRGAPGGGP